MIKVKRKFANISKSILTRRTFLLSVLLLIFSLNIPALYLIQNIETQYSLDQFQPKNHELISQSQEVEQRFLINKASPYIVSLSFAPESTDNWASPQSLELLQSFDELIGEHEHIIQITSLTSIEVAVVDEHSFHTGSVQEWSADKILNDPLLKSQLISKDGKHTNVIITPDLLSMDDHTHLMGWITRNARQTFGPHTRVQVGGPAAIRTEVTSVLPKEIGRFAILALLISLLIVSLVFRGWSAPLISLSIALTANMIGLALLSALSIPLTVLSNTVPILITITVIAIVSHSLSKLSGMVSAHQDPIDSVYNTMKNLIGPHLLTALTTCIGFATLYFSDVPVISNYGLSVSLSVMIAGVVTLIALPCLMVMLPTPARRQWSMDTQQISHWIMGNSKALVPLIIVAVALLGWQSQKLNWSPQLFDDLPAQQASRQATLFIDQHLGGTVPLELSIGEKTKEGTKPWHVPHNLLQLQELTRYVRGLSTVGSVTSLTDFISVSQSDGAIPTSPKAIAEIYFLYGMGQENPIENYLTPNGAHTRMSLRLKDVPSQKMQAEINKIVDQAQKRFPDMSVQVSGTAATIHPINQEMSAQLMYGFFTALVWIVLLLTLVFGSLTWALVSVIPNLLPPISLLGVMALTQTAIKPNIAIIFAISLGIAFDNTVYILSKLKNLKKHNPLDQSLIIKTLSEEMGPCFLASFSLMAGFSIFLISYFSMNQLFGAFMLVSISAGLIGDLVLLPILLGKAPALLSFSLSHDILVPSMRYLRMLPNYKKATASFVFIFILLMGWNQSDAATPMTADFLIGKIKKNNVVPDEKAEIKMLIKERDGSTKERELVIKKKNNNGQKALVKLQKPADLKGVGLLSEAKGGDETQWLYLPSEKRSRRIASSNKNGKFLDSDLTYEDMSLSTYENFNNSIEKQVEGKNVAILVSVAKDKDASSYGKIRTWVDTKNFRILQSQYYDSKGKLVKKMRFDKYKKYGNVWRAGIVRVEDIKKKRSTTLQLKSVSLKSINEGDLSMSALEAG
jgi:uncharacterized protein